MLLSTSILVTPMNKTHNCGWIIKDELDGLDDNVPSFADVTKVHREMYPISIPHFELYPYDKKWCTDCGNTVEISRYLVTLNLFLYRCHTPGCGSLFLPLTREQIKYDKTWPW